MQPSHEYFKNYRYENTCRSSLRVTRKSEINCCNQPIWGSNGEPAPNVSRSARLCVYLPSQIQFRTASPSIQIINTVRNRACCCRLISSPYAPLGYVRGGCDVSSCDCVHAPVRQDQDSADAERRLFCCQYPARRPASLCCIDVCRTYANSRVESSLLRTVRLY